MQILNLSAEIQGKLYSWLPHNLKAEKVVFLPDACPGKSPLPTGTAVLTRQPDWRQFALSDCGCGMRLIKSEIPVSRLDKQKWNELAIHLKENKGGLGDLGGGNHFLDAIVPEGGEDVYFLIHTGSRKESGLVDEFVDQQAVFDRQFDRIVGWAEENRATIQSLVEEIVGPTQLVLDLPHNTYEELADGAVIIRKGSVRVMPGDLNVIPSSMADDIVLVRATQMVEESLFSLSHGTGRTMSRSDSKSLARNYDWDGLYDKVMIPDLVSRASLTTEGPFAYRGMDDCLSLLDGFVEVVERFKVVGYIGHL